MRAPDVPAKRSFIAKESLIAGGAVTVILVQVLLLRAFGDVVTSLMLFGLGYLAAWLRHKR